MKLVLSSDTLDRYGRVFHARTDCPGALILTMYHWNEPGRVDIHMYGYSAHSHYIEPWANTALANDAMTVEQLIDYLAEHIRVSGLAGALASLQIERRL